MWERIRSSFEGSLGRIASAVAAFLPGLIAFLIIAGLALVSALLVRGLVRRLLQRVGFDRWVRRWALSPEGEWPAQQSPAVFVARVAFWLVVCAGILLGLSVFDTVALNLLAYLPRLMVAVVVFAAGMIAARFLERNVLISAVNMQIHSARLLSLGVKWLVMVFAAAMALQQLDVGGSLVTICFSILFGGIVLSLSLAVGLGSRDMVSKTLERQILKEKGAEGDDDVRHV